MCASRRIQPIEAARTAHDGAATSRAWAVRLPGAVYGKQGMTAAVQKKSKLVSRPLSKSASVQALESRVGLKMRHTRLLKGLTLKKLADLAGCSESLLSRIENGSANPSIKTM